MVRICCQKTGEGCFRIRNTWCKGCVCVCVCVCVCESAQSCLSLCDPMDLACQAPLSMEISIQENCHFQTRILEWVAISSSRGSSRPKDRTLVSSVSCIGRQVLNQLHHLGNPWYKCILAYQEPNRIRG